MNACTVAPDSAPVPRHVVPLKERFTVWWRNLKYRKVGKAWKVLEEEIRNDPSYHQVILSNIAMPIYDATRMKCMCEYQTGKCDWCKNFKEDARRFEFTQMSGQQANFIAERIINHLFKRPK